MNFNLMKFIDKYAGWLACAILTALEHFFSLFRVKTAPHKNQKIKNILMMKFWGIGSIMLATPLLKALREKFPEAKIHFLTLSRNKEFVKLLEPVDEVMILDIDHGFLSFCASVLRSIFSMRKINLDIVFDLEFFTRFSAIMAYLSGAKEKVGFWAWEVWRGDLHTTNVPFNRYWHIKKNFYNLGSAVGLPMNARLELLKPIFSANEKSDTEAIMKKFDLEPKQYVCINPNAGELALTRRWPKENFEILTKKILKEFPNIKTVFIGSAREVASTSTIVSSVKTDLFKTDSKKVIDTSGQLKIKELLIIIKNSKLFISNDSGPLHLAAALEVPTVSFFGPETPVLYGHFGEKDVVFFKSIDCSPCINVHEGKASHCYRNSPICLENIKPEEVWEEVKKLI